LIESSVSSTFSANGAGHRGTDGATRRCARYGRRTLYKAASVESEKQTRERKPKRVLGDEWLEWREGSSETEIREGKRTFLAISLAILIGFISLIFLFWYLILPRFELYGGFWATSITVAVVVAAGFFMLWYALLLFALFSRNSYLNICLRKGTTLFCPSR
jgi:hypothetical protein